MGRQVFSAARGEAAYLVPDDVEDPSRKLIRQVLGAVAENERYQNCWNACSHGGFLR
jgi:hypothetical protein